MAYEKHTWIDGEVITEDKLNHIEDGIANAGGFECTETRTLLTEESVTTDQPSNISYAMRQLSYSNAIDSDIINVTFDGTQYTLEINQYGNFGWIYGDETQGSPDFSRYPFMLYCTDELTYVCTEQAGNYTVKIESVSLSVETSECFEKAVEQVSAPMFVTFGGTTAEEAAATITDGAPLDATWIEIYKAHTSGKRIILKMNPHMRDYIRYTFSSEVIAVSEATTATADFKHSVSFCMPGNVIGSATCETQNDYPVIYEWVGSN